MSPILASSVALLPPLPLPRFVPAIKPPIQLQAVASRYWQVPLTHSAGNMHRLPAAIEQLCPTIGLATHTLFIIDEQKASPRHW
jgi:hypothetical protein